jgi:molybdopterin-guanine dinucleotide biosynthesis protein
MCANLLCDRERLCAACKEDGRTWLASVLARKIATYDDPVIVESYSLDETPEVRLEDDYEGGGPMYSRGEERIGRMQDRAFRRSGERRKS